MVCLKKYIIFKIVKASARITLKIKIIFQIGDNLVGMLNLEMRFIATLRECDVKPKT